MHVFVYIGLETWLCRLPTSRWWHICHRCECVGQQTGGGHSWCLCARVACVPSTAVSSISPAHCLEYQLILPLHLAVLVPVTKPTIHWAPRICCVWLVAWARRDPPHLLLHATFSRSVALCRPGEIVNLWATPWPPVLIMWRLVWSTCRIWCSLPSSPGSCPTTPRPSTTSWTPSPRRYAECLYII